MDTSPGQHSADMRLLEKRAEQVARQEAARPISERVDHHGKVRVWNLMTEKFVALWPIDAREQINRGYVLLDKPGGEEDSNNTLDPEEMDACVKPIDFSKHTIPQMRELARLKGVDLTGLQRRDDICSALELALSQKPPEDEEHAE